MTKKEQAKKTEYILCAAIWFDNGNIYAKQPVNIESGLVFCGWRHGCIFSQIGGTIKERQNLGYYQKEQGFLTSKNRFVSRSDAAHIAFDAGQIKELVSHLYSEDIY